MTFSFSRFLQLIKMEIQQNFFRMVLINALVFIVIIFLNTVQSFWPGQGAAVHLHSNFLGVLIIGGIIAGTLSFNELFKRHSRINFLNLPASATEKVTSKALVYILLFPIALFFVFLIVKGIYIGIQNLTDGRIWVADKFELEYKYLIPTVLLCISVFFYGAVRFNTYGFVWTTLGSLIVFLLLAAFTFLSSYIIFPELRLAIAGKEQQFYMGPGPDIESHWLFSVYKFLWYVAPLIFVSLSIMCLKEKEG